MVSIHIVPIVVYLTIRVLCFIFRFKREAPQLLLAPHPEALGLPYKSKRTTSKPHAVMYNNPLHR